MCTFNEYISQRLPTGGRRTKDFDFENQDNQKALVVDDSVSSGWEMRRLRAQFESSGIIIETLFLAAYVSNKSRDLVDIALEISDPPQIFEWNITLATLSRRRPGCGHLPCCRNTKVPSL